MDCEAIVSRATADNDEVVADKKRIRMVIVYLDACYLSNRAISRERGGVDIYLAGAAEKRREARQLFREK